MRARLMTLLTLVVAAISLLAGAVSVHAKPALQASAVVQPHHDMSSPMRENYPCPGSAHSGIGKFGSSPSFNCSSATSPAPRSVSPYTGQQSGNCVNGVTYLQKLSNGDGQLWAWTADTTTSNSYPSGYSMTGWIEYYWCPAVNSSKYPNGINYSYGEEWPQSKWNGSCAPMYVGALTGYSSTPPKGYTYGARLLHSDRSYTGDAEGSTHYSICPGNYVWDYSDLADGTYSYTAQIDCATSSNYPTDDFTIAWPHAQ